VRTKGLRVLKVDGELQALRMLIDRREALTRRRVQTVNRLQALLAELLPGQTKKDISPLQAKRCWRRSVPGTSLGRPAAGSRPRSWPS
jgi:transposase